MTQSLWLGELLAMLISAVLLMGYHGAMLRSERRAPGSTLAVWLRQRREDWVARMVAEQQGILAVQTLRNQMMLATFFASTAVLLIIGVLTLTSHSDELALLWSNLSLLGSMEPRWFRIKLLLLLLNLLAAFATFSQTLRLLSHVSFLISTKTAARGDAEIAVIARLYASSGRWQTIGLRHYYFALPLLLWLFDPLLLVLSTAALVLFLYRSQRVPQADPAGR